MKHEVAPWIITRGRRNYYLTSNGNKKIRAHTRFAKIYHDECQHEISEGTLKLISSAPELLEALTTIRDAFWTEGESFEKQVKDLKSIAENAISKLREKEI